MKKLLLLFGFVVLIFGIVLGQTNSKHVKVNGYYRKDGTYVKGHYRTAPNSTNRDNFSTRYNVNPYTGEPGYVKPDNNSLNYPSTSSSYNHNQSEDSESENPVFEKLKQKYFLDSETSELKLTAYYKKYCQSKPKRLTNSLVSLKEYGSSYADNIATIPHGEELHVISIAFDGWSEVYYKGQIGYVSSKYLISLNENAFIEEELKKNVSPVGYFYVVTKETSLRDFASSESKVLKRFSVGNKVKVLESSDKYWWKVYYNGRQGWVKCALLERK